MAYTYSCLFSQLAFILVVMFLISVSRSHNIRHVNAILDEENNINQELLTSWNNTCNISGGTVTIPNGEFLLNPITFKGPCAGPITFMVNGVLKAPNTTFLNTTQWILFNNLQNVTVTGNGTLDGQGAYAWIANTCKFNASCNTLPVNIKFNNVIDGKINRITSINSKFFHINIDNSQNIEIKHVNISALSNSNNTDGVHVERSNNVLIHNLDIGTGDDCISIGQGSTNVMIKEVNCGPGHGISIGSLGKYENEKDVSGIVVKNCTLANTTNGVRIKTWASSLPSKLSNVTFQDIILKNASNPIVVTQHYCPNNICEDQGESKVQISDVKFINITGSSQDEVSANIDCSKDVPCQDLKLISLNIRYNGTQPTQVVCSNFNGTLSAIY